MLTAGSRRTITCTFGNGAATLYVDGVAVARKTGVTTLPASISDAIDHYLGRWADQPGRYLKGDLRDFRLYGRVLSPGEARELAKTTASGRPAADAAALDLGDVSAVTGDLALPAKSPGGSAISWASSTPVV